jgi:hypothetical protein
MYRDEYKTNKKLSSLQTSFRICEGTWTTALQISKMATPCFQRKFRLRSRFRLM